MEERQRAKGEEPFGLPDCQTSSSSSPMTFHPCRWLANRHLQTLWSALAPRRVPLDVRWEAWDTPDGDRVDLAWAGPATGRTVIVLHGLDGNLDSAYARPLMAALVRRGWRVVLLCARGTSGHPNRQARSYHSGFTEDLDALVRRLAPAGPLAAVGISVGGNQLLHWLGEQGKACPLVAAAAACVPYDLARCDAALSTGFARVYQRHLVAGLVRAYRAKAHLLPVPETTWHHATTFRDLDAHLTARLHHFPSVEAYYAAASSRPWVARIAIPTHLIHADDDPFVPEDSLPTDLPPHVTLERHHQGGHVGFIAGPWWPHPWLEERLAEVLTAAADCPRRIAPG